MPSQINNFAQLIAVLTLQKQNLASYLTQVNATAADVTEVTDELENLTAIATFADLIDGFKKTVFEIKQAFYDGELDEPIAAIPGYPAVPLFSNSVAGCLTRTRDRNRRFKAAPGYTDQIGDALGIGPGEGSEPIVTAPTIQVTASQMGYEYSVVVSNRQQSDAWEVLVQPVGSTTWTSAGTRTGKSADFTYNPGSGSGDNPVQIRVMVQLKKNNANYADPSDQVSTTVNP